MEEREKAPFYLLIHTDSYTGNFERELVAYSFGILDDAQKGYGREYIKAFWNSVIATDIDSLADYEKADLTYMDIEANIEMLDSLEKILKDKENSHKQFDVNKCLEDMKEQRRKEVYQKDIRRLYDTYLCNTHQTVDDWEQDTFYNIESYYKNKEYNCDTIYVQLKNPLSPHLEEIVINRIKGFFKVYKCIEDYTWICHFGEPKMTTDKDCKLLGLELVDTDYNLIKTYDI